MHYTKLDVINIFKTVKGQRPVKKLPKLSSDSLLQVQNLTDNFNTKWSNIVPSLYFETGLNLWKTFSYPKFMDDSIFKKYVQKDKQIKRKKIDRHHITKSFLYIKSQVNSLKEFTNYYWNDTIHTCCLDFFYNKIDKVTMAYLMFYVFKPTEHDKRYTNYIWNNEKHMRGEVKRWYRVIQKCERDILL